MFPDEALGYSDLVFGYIMDSCHLLEFFFRKFWKYHSVLFAFSLQQTVMTFISKADCNFHIPQIAVF